jgi:hypothetical protein
MDSLDSSFCTIKPQQRDLPVDLILSLQTNVSPNVSRSRVPPNRSSISSPNPLLPQVNFYEPQQSASYSEQLASSFPNTSPIPIELYNLSPTMLVNPTNAGNNVNISAPGPQTDLPFSLPRQAEDMDMDDPVLNSLQTLAQAGESLGEPQNFNFDVWDWFTSQEGNVT